MLTDSLPMNAASSFDMNRPSPPPHAMLPFARNGRARLGHDQRADRVPQHHHAAVEVLDPIVEISPSDIVKRRTASWPGMAAEIVQATRCDWIESRFCAPVHLLAVYESGVRHDGGTVIEGLPKSTMRNLRRKCIFVPAGHKYHDWQEPRILSRVVYFYFDPASLAISPELDFAGISLAPRLFFEDSALWETALKLTMLIESARSDHRLYVEALGVVLAHELVRLNAGTACVEPQVRGGLAAWQQRVVVAHIEEHLADPISLATLAQLARLSPFHFCRAFKQSFGVPPHRYHTSRRIDRAKVLLAAPRVSVTEAALQVGFSTTSAFSATFHRVTGHTPSDYRRSLE
jgi:AraC family transcriptional regulator